MHEDTNPIHEVLPSRAPTPNSTSGELGVKFRESEETHFQEPAEIL